MPLETALYGIPSDVLKKAFTAQAKTHHPDKSIDDDIAALQFRKIRASYEELTVPPGNSLESQRKRASATYWAKLCLCPAKTLASEGITEDLP